VYARVSTYQGPPDQIDAGVRYAQENILPKVGEIDGFEGVYFLVDRQSGKALSITLWESEEAMRASEEEANRLRSESAEAGGQDVMGVDRYEVAVSPERS
jgi:heme-degrading monooxygenase HmoA